MKLVHFSRSYR